MEELVLRLGISTIVLEVVRCNRQRRLSPERSDILNIGGFSDAVFNVVSSFLKGDASRFVREVESVEL